MKIPEKLFARQHEITNYFLNELDKHLSAITEGQISVYLHL